MSIERPEVFSATKVDIINYFKSNKFTFSILFWISLLAFLGFGYGAYLIQKEKEKRNRH